MALTIEPMTSKERLHKLVDELSEAETDETLRFAIAHHEGRNVDEWGDLDAFGARSSSAALRRLDEQETGAGFSWEEHRRS